MTLYRTMCVVEVSECQIRRKYSATLDVIETKNIILPLDDCFCFK